MFPEIPAPQTLHAIVRVLVLVRHEDLVPYGSVPGEYPWEVLDDIASSGFGKR